MEKYTIRPIAHIRSDYNEKFGVPRQAGLVSELEQEIVFEDEFGSLDAVRGLEGFSRIWLIWGFTGNMIDMDEVPAKWHKTVRPPRLDGKTRKGVFASRSPYRPNSLGISNVELIGIRYNGKLVLTVRGADLVDGTPIFDIKPYIPYSDSHPDAKSGYSRGGDDGLLEVEFPYELLERIDENKREGLIHVLALDPRGAYEKKDGYTYGMSFGRWDIKFTVEGSLLTVTGIEDRQ